MSASRNMGKCGGEYSYKPTISSEAKKQNPYNRKEKKKQPVGNLPSPAAPMVQLAIECKWGLTLKPVDCRAVPLPRCTEIALIYTMKAVSKTVTKGPHPFLTKSIAKLLFKGERGAGKSSSGFKQQRRVSKFPTLSKAAGADPALLQWELWQLSLLYSGHLLWLL